MTKAVRDSVGAMNVRRVFLWLLGSLLLWMALVVSSPPSALAQAEGQAAPDVAEPPKEEAEAPPTGDAGAGTVEADTALADAITSLRELETQRSEFRKQVKTEEGDNLLVAEVQLYETDEVIWKELQELVALIAEDLEGSDAATIAFAQETLGSHYQDLLRDRRLQEVKTQRLSSIRSRRDGAELLDLVSDLTDASTSLDTIYSRLISTLSMRETLGESVDREWKLLDTDLEEREERLVSKLSALDEQVAKVKALAADTDDDKAAAKKELRIIRTLIKTNEKNLKALSEQLQSRDADSSTIDQLLLERSGEINIDILDTDVALGLLASWRTSVVDWFKSQGPAILFKLIIVALILLLSLLVAAIARWLARRAVKRSRFSKLLQDFLVALFGKIVMLTGIIIALIQVGFSLGPILAGLGVAGFVIGFALQDTLSNFASGLMILVYRPFDVGDLIEGGGVLGHVQEMTLVSTTITTVDNQRFFVPNNKIWGGVIKNVFVEKNRRVDMVFGIGYGDDIDKARAVLEAIVEEHEAVLSDPKPVIRVHTLGESSVDFVVRPWATAEDYWQVYWDVTESVKKRFDAEGISIPFPQRDVHVFKEAA